MNPDQDPRLARGAVRNDIVASETGNTGASLLADSMAGLRSVTDSNGVVTSFVRFAPNGCDMRLYELPQLPDLDGVGAIVDNIAAGGPATVSFDGRAGQTYLIRCAQFGNATEEAYHPDKHHVRLDSVLPEQGRLLGAPRGIRLAQLPAERGTK